MCERLHKGRLHRPAGGPLGAAGYNGPRARSVSARSGFEREARRCSDAPAANPRARTRAALEPARFGRKPLISMASIRRALCVPCVSHGLVPVWRAPCDGSRRGLAAGAFGSCAGAPTADSDGGGTDAHRSPISFSVRVRSVQADSSPDEIHPSPGTPASRDTPRIPLATRRGSHRASLPALLRLVSLQRACSVRRFSAVARAVAWGGRESRSSMR